MKLRCERLSPSEAQWSTTKSDGMWKFLPCIEVKRPVSHPEPPGAALLSLSLLSIDSKGYAMAMRLKRVW
jgi:hypothetical protein